MINQLFFERKALWVKETEAEKAQVKIATQTAVKKAARVMVKAAVVGMEPVERDEMDE